MARVHFCLDFGGVEEDQRFEISFYYCFFERDGDRWPNPASSGPTAAGSEECGDVYRFPGAGNARLHHQERSAGSENLRRYDSDPGADRGVRAIQRSRRHAGVAEMAAYIHAEAQRDLSGAWRAGGGGTVEGCDRQGVGMECTSGAVDGESADWVKYDLVI